MGRILKIVLSAWLISNLFIGTMLLVSTDFRKSVMDILVMLPVYYGFAVRTFITFIWGIGTTFFIAMVNTVGYGAALAISYMLLLVVALVPLAFVLLIAEGESGSVGGGSDSEGRKAETFPLFEAHSIEEAIGNVIGDDKILMNSSGERIGVLEKSLHSGTDQIVYDSMGRMVGRIDEDIVKKDTQSIKDAYGREIGEIRTDLTGRRVITDSKGNKIGTLEKIDWETTRIKKDDC